MRTAVAVVLAFSVLAGGALSAMAQPAQDIVVAGMVVVRIRVPAGGLSVAQRVVAVTLRINQALTAEDLSPSNFYLEPSGPGVTIRVGRVVLITVTPADAAANQTTVQPLAQRWLQALRTALPRAKPLNRP